MNYLTPVEENAPAAEPSQQSELTEDDFDAGTVVTAATDDSPPPFTSVSDWKDYGGDATELLMDKMFSWKGLEFNDTRYLFIMNGLAEIERRRLKVCPYAGEKTPQTLSTTDSNSHTTHNQ